MSEKRRAVSFFVVVFDRQDRRPIHINCYEKEDEALSALFQAEDRYLARRRDGNRYEVVLLGAESLDDLHKTHSRYFAHDPIDRDHLIAL